MSRTTRLKPADKSRVLQIESCFSRAGAAAVVSKVITVYRVLRSAAVRLQEQTV